MNRNKTLWLAGALALTAGSSLAQTARLQVIHNSADAAAAVVDVYVNGALLINDFGFRTAWGYNDVPAGVDLQVGIAPGNSTSAADTIAGLGATYNLPDGGTFVLVANGIVIPAGYNPVQPFELYAAAGQETSGAGTTAVNVFHGATDAPAVDVFESAVLGVTAISNLAYSDFTGYLALPTDDYVLEVRPAGSPNTLVAYSAPLATLGLDGVALNVVASGFLDPSVNNNGPAFGLWVALASGGALVELPLSTSLQENDGVSALNVWPNPSNDQLFVSLSSERTIQAQIRLTDLTGRVVRTVATNGLAAGENRLVIDLNGLAEGMYQLSIAGEGAVRTVPVQVVR